VTSTTLNYNQWMKSACNFKIIAIWAEQSGVTEPCESEHSTENETKTSGLQTSV